jgi:phage terminase large subunit-like protein
MVMTEEPRNRRFTEDLDIAGHQLIETVRRLIAEGNVSRLRIRAEDGSVFLEIPLTAGAVAGGVIVLTAPWLAAIGAIAGLATKVRVEIVRDADSSDSGAEPPA